MTSNLHTPLPNELIDYVIDFLHDDRKALKACSLASKTFRRSAVPILFAGAKMVLGDPPSPDLDAFFQIVPLVRTLRILWWNASADHNPLPALSQPRHPGEQSPLANVTGIIHDYITYPSQTRSTTEFYSLLIPFGGANTLTELRFNCCRFPTLAALTYTLDSCVMLKTLAVRTMFLDDFKRGEEESHQIGSKHLRTLILGGIEGELDAFMRWIASRPTLPPLDTVSLPNFYQPDVSLVKHIRRFSPHCVFKCLGTSEPICIED